MITVIRRFPGATLRLSVVAVLLLERAVATAKVSTYETYCTHVPAVAVGLESASLLFALLMTLLLRANSWPECQRSADCLRFTMSLKFLGEFVGLVLGLALMTVSAEVF